jgi:hypothetical protein
MAVAYDSHNSGGGFSVSSISFPLTVSGSDRLLWVGVMFYQNGNTFVADVTFNGVSATVVPSSTKNNGPLWIQQYTLVAPDTGEQTLEVQFGGNAAFDIGVVAISFTGVDQTTPLGTAVTATDTSTTPSVTVTDLTADDFVVDILGIAHSGTLTVGANQTQRSNAVAGGYYKRGSSTQDGTDGGVMSWSNSTSQAWAIGAVPIKAVAAAASLPHHLMLLGVGR